ncbi:MULTISPECIES: hypothetical protein [unclassified Polynucleobacter]|jgi:primosomal protein N'|uniref:hypothetical protein n=1 Tax=unclassified Polynucleobacter TaxID=2640945 RepID=UPI000BC5DDC8|nr:MULTISPECIES: hypothetical protein [unclassified Polynucleobacter]OYY21382.1 MAG: hypothetical protein B7Y67_01905 [Polynucleobacter sp. 35-46-11]OZA78165.1 MAG: hypothetical protein B7X71_01970 [Polynucleobacter sp. 39-46-10]
MANSALHAITIEELRHSDPNFHREYCKLVEGITNLIREIAKSHPNELDYTSFIESYDRASNEPVLQIVIGSGKNEVYLHIYIHQNKYFVIGKSGSGKSAKTASQALEIIATSLSVP